MERSRRTGALAVEKKKQQGEGHSGRRLKVEGGKKRVAFFFFFVVDGEGSPAKVSLSFYCLPFLFSIRASSSRFSVLILVSLA